jgi:hypothetical protein
MANKHYQEKGDSNRIEWFQQLYREWKEKDNQVDMLEIYDYFAEDDCDIDLKESFLR